jgi:hypothetical protein
MTRNALALLDSLAIVTVPALAADTSNTGAMVSQLESAPPNAPFVKASQAIKGLPDFIPTMGVVYVDPKTLPYGPYLGYDRQGKLVDTVYMITIKEFNAHQKMPEMGAPSGRVDHVGVYYNPGHAGIPEPHYHFVLWHVPASQESLVAK